MTTDCSVCTGCGCFAHKNVVHRCTGNHCARTMKTKRRHELLDMRASIQMAEGYGGIVTRKLEHRREYNAKLRAHRQHRATSH